MSLWSSTNRASMFDVPSPCNRVCRLSSNGICGGCGRAQYEIAMWSTMDSLAKAQVVEMAKHRLHAMRKPQGEGAGAQTAPLRITQRTTSLGSPLAQDTLAKPQTDSRLPAGTKWKATDGGGASQASPVEKTSESA